MSEEQNWTGINARSGCGGLWLIVVVAVALVACVGGLGLLYGIEDSRANRAQARASAENAQAAARAAEARAEVDVEQVRADRDVTLTLERYRHELAVLREENRQFQQRLIMLATVIERMNDEQLDRLEVQMGDERTPLWWLAVAASLAGLVFMLGLLGWRAWRDYGGPNL